MRSRAALFWLLGAGLMNRLNVPPTWDPWFTDAFQVGRQFAATGEHDARAATLWAHASRSTDEHNSQHLNSAIVCVSTPLGLECGEVTRVGQWVEHALFPALQSASMRLFGDVLLPGDDDDLDQVFGQPEVQSAVGFCLDVVEQLEADQTPTDDWLERAMVGADVLVP